MSWISKQLEKFRLKKIPKTKHKHQMKMAVVTENGKIVEHDAKRLVVGGRMLTLCAGAKPEDVRIGIRCSCMPYGVYVRTAGLDEDEFSLDKTAVKGAVN